MSEREIELVYFAWVRERIGRTGERLALPASVRTPAALMDHLAGLDETYANAFADRSLIRVALDKRVADDDAALGDAREVAFFPPMTGG